MLPTVRQAADLDHQLTVLPDGCLDTDPEVHRVLTKMVLATGQCGHRGGLDRQPDGSSRLTSGAVPSCPGGHAAVVSRREPRTGYRK